MRAKRGSAKDGRGAGAKENAKGKMRAAASGDDDDDNAAAPFEKSIAIVGAGRLGTALGRALAASGYHVSAVVARRRSHALAASRLISTRPRAFSAEQLKLLPSTHLLVITTPDDALAETAARLAAALVVAGTGRRRRVALHASGAHSSELLAPLRERGFRVGSMHPLVSVSDPRDGAESFRGGFFCVEGEPGATSAARRIVRTLGGHAFSVRTRDKALYHASAVMTSGHTVALFDAAIAALARCGLTETQARAALIPLLRSTVENLSTQTPARALTGSYARGDAETIRQHLAALADPDLYRRGVTTVYAVLGEQSVKLARRAGLSPASLRKVERALSDAVAAWPTRAPRPVGSRPGQKVRDDGED